MKNKTLAIFVVLMLAVSVALGAVTGVFSSIKIGANTVIPAGTLGYTGTGYNVLSASPALTGVPTAPTAAPGTNTTQLATTAFVTATSGAYSIIAKVQGSCTLVDDSSGGSGCISSAISWGVTMPANYDAWCAVNALSGSVLWQNHTSVSIVGTPPLSGSTVTFALDNQQSSGRGQTATVTCWATN